MSISSGFYNSLNGDRRYNAEQMSALFDTIINDGVFANVGTAFEVKSTGGMKVSIGIGRAWFNSTWLYNDSPISLTLSASEVLLDRYDAVVLEIDHTESVRAGDIKIIKGTPSSNPQFPSMTSETEVHQYPLAYIYVKAGVTEITQANITNKIGTSDCPFITGILQVQNIDKIVAQWMAEWEQLMDAKEEEFDNWFATIKAILDEDIATELLNRVVKLEDGTTPAGDALKLNGLTAEEFVSNPNLLINSDFRNPVNSSGKTEWSKNEITVDEWWTANANSTVTLDKNGLTFTKTAAEYTWFAQNIYELDALAGQTVTLSTKVNGIVGSKTWTLPTTLPSETVDNGGLWFNNCSVNLYKVGSNPLQVRFLFNGKVGDTFTVEWVKFELGKVATPITPPNKEVEKLKCGIVDNAKTANGVTLYKEFTEIDSTFTQDTPITDVVAKMAPDSKLCVTIYASTTGIYPSGNGVLEIDKHSVNGNFTAVKFTDRNNGKLYTAVVQLDTFVGWKYSADGGNADTVDNYHAHQLQLVGSDDVPMGAFLVARHNVDGDNRFKLITNLGNEVSVTNADTVGGLHASDFQKTNDIRTIIGKSPTIETDIRAFMVQLPSGTYVCTLGTDLANVIAPIPNGYSVMLIWNRQEDETNHFMYGDLTIKTLNTNDYSYSCTIWNTNNYTEWVDNYRFLPLDGSVPMSGNLRTSNGYVEVGGDGNHASLSAINVPSDYSNQRRLMVLNSAFAPDVKNSLQLWDSVNGAVYPYTVLHTGNSQKVATSASAPSDTTALWVVPGN